MQGIQAGQEAVELQPGGAAAGARRRQPAGGGEADGARGRCAVPRPQPGEPPPLGAAGRGRGEAGGRPAARRPGRGRTGAQALPPFVGAHKQSVPSQPACGPAILCLPPGPAWQGSLPPPPRARACRTLPSASTCSWSLGTSCRRTSTSCLTSSRRSSRRPRSSSRSSRSRAKAQPAMAAATCGACPRAAAPPGAALPSVHLRAAAQHTCALTLRLVPPPPAGIW